MQPRGLVMEIVEEHLGDAAFLAARWESALEAYDETPESVLEGDEERLIANLDGLRVAGVAAADALLMPALEGDDAGQVFAAAWTLAGSGAPPARAALLALFETAE